MSDHPPQMPGPDEKTIPLMAYTAEGILIGDALAKLNIRFSTWLRSPAVPDRICFLNARLIRVTPGTHPKPASYARVFIPTSSILGYHLTPPAEDPLDYDPTEPNRSMEPVSAFTGPFRLDGLMRVPSRTGLAGYMQITQEIFISLYDAEISCPAMPALGVLRSPFVLLRQLQTIFAAQS